MELEIYFCFPFVFTDYFGYAPISVRLLMKNRSDLKLKKREVNCGCYNYIMELY